MRQIKFRGLDLSGKMRFGFYAESAGFPYIIEKHNWYEVQSRSVAQLVGYDCDGREVYEGDKLINDRDNTKFTAAMNHIYTVKKYRLLEETE